MNASELVTRIQEYGEIGNLDCMDDTLVRILRAAKDQGSLSLGEITEIVVDEMALDGE